MVDKDVRLDERTYESVCRFFLNACEIWGSLDCRLDLERKLLWTAAEILDGETCLTPTVGEIAAERERRFGLPLSDNDRLMVAEGIRQRMAEDRDCARLVLSYSGFEPVQGSWLKALDGGEDDGLLGPSLRRY
jgi:hypothetical protein